MSNLIYERISGKAHQLIYLYNRRPKQPYFSLITSHYPYIVASLSLLAISAATWTLAPIYLVYWLALVVAYYGFKKLIAAIYPLSFQSHWFSEAGSTVRAIVFSVTVSLFILSLFSFVQSNVGEISASTLQKLDTLWILYYLGTLITNRSGARTTLVIGTSIFAAGAMAVVTTLTFTSASVATDVLRATLIARMTWLTLINFVTHAHIRFLNEQYMNARMSETVADTIAEMRSVSDEAQLLQVFSREIASNFRIQSVRIFMSEKRSSDLRARGLRCVASSETEVDLTFLQCPLGNTELGYLNKRFGNFIVETDESEVRYQEANRETKRLWLPIKHRDKMFGVIGLQIKQHRRLSYTEFELLDRVLARFAVALDNISIVDRLRRILNHLSDRIMLQQDSSSILREIAQAIHDELNADLVMCYWRDPTTGEIEGPVAAGQPLTTIPPKTQLFYPDSVVYRWSETSDFENMYFDRDVRNPKEPKLFVPVAYTEEKGSLPFIARERIVSRAAIRLTAGTDCIGIMFVNFRSQRVFAPDDEQWISAFAHLATLSISAAQRNQRQLKQELELQRQNLIMHMHENMISKLRAALHGLTNVINHPDATEDQRNSLGMVFEATSDVLKALRYLHITFTDLRLGHLRDEIQRIAEHAQEWFGVEFFIEGNLSGTESIDRHLTSEIVSMINEFVANSGLYAEPSSMRLSLCIEPSSIELQFSDDGKGFDPEYVKASGLENVRQRAQRCGGHAKLYSAIGKGTQHKVTLPRIGV